MIKVRCTTNLDVSNLEKWPSALPALPRVGDYIDSAKVVNNTYRTRLRLKVVSVSFEYVPNNDEWVPVVELHLPEGRSIKEFMEWYEHLHSY